MYKKLTKQQANRLEQRTLRTSVFTIVGLAIAGIGFGRFYNLPNASLVGATATDSNLANATIGARYHITERFVARLDYTIFTTYLSDTRTSEYWAATGGLAFFF